MDKDSIKEFLEGRYKELAQNEQLPSLKKKEIEKTSEVKKDSSSKTFYIVLLVIILSTIFFGYKVYQRWNVNQADQNSVLLERVSLLTDLPSEEVPTIATVTNANMVRNQVFFKEALNGDKMIIYNTAKKAILYRPSTNKVVSIAPLN